MSIEDDVVVLERVPTLRLLGGAALRMVAIGSEQRDIIRGDLLFKQGDDADFRFRRSARRIPDRRWRWRRDHGRSWHLDRRTRAGGADEAASERDCTGILLRYPHYAQPVSTGAGKRSRRGGAAARRVRRPLEPDRQRYLDRGREAERLALPPGETRGGASCNRFRLPASPSPVRGRRAAPSRARRDKSGSR